MSRRVAGALALAVAFSSGRIVRASGDTLFWNGGTFGWAQTNWSSTQFPMDPTRIPDSTDTATLGSGIANVFATYGVFNVNVQGSAGLDGTGRLVIGGNLYDLTSGNIACDLTLNGTVDWRAGTWNGIGSAATVSSTGSMSIYYGAHDLNGRTLINNGTVSNIGYAVRGGNGTSIVNNGTWTDASDIGNQIFNTDYGGAATFTNSPGATFQHQGNYATSFGGTFLNYGRVDAQSGTISLSNTTAFNGAEFRAESGGTNVFPGNVTFNGTVSFTGAGYNGMVAGQVSGDNVFQGAFNWDGGNFGSANTTVIAAGAALNITVYSADLPNHTIVNNGTINHNGGVALRGGAAGSLILNNWVFVEASSVDVAYNSDFGGPGLTFSNTASGTFRKTSGSVLNASMTFNNDGLVDVQAGTMNLLYGSGSNGSTFRTSASSMITFGSYLLSSGTIYSGPGLFQLVGPGSQVNGFVGAQRFDIAGGINSLRTVTFSGSTVTWTGGNLNAGGVVTVAATSTLAISVPTADMVNTVFYNYGTVTRTSTSVRGGNAGSAIYNEALWVDAAPVDGVFNSDYGGAGLIFYNDPGGTFRKTTATTMTFLTPFYQRGAIDTRAGTVAIQSGGEAYNGATFAASAGATNAFTGSYVLDGTVAFTGGGANELAGGTLQGDFAVSGSLLWVGGNLNSAGTATILPGASLVANVAPADLANRVLVNNGTVTRLLGDLRGGSTYGSTIVNNGLFLDSVAADSSIWNPFGGNPFEFSNAATGTFRKTTASTTSITAYFENAGLLDVRAGTVSLSGGTSLGGSTLRTVASSSVEFAGYSVASGVNYQGPGLFRIAGGNNAFAGTINGSRFEIAAGSTQLNDVTFSASSVTWTGGNLNLPGGFTVAPTSSLVLAVPGNTDFANTSFVNNGVVTHLSGDVRGGSTFGSLVVNNALWIDASPSSTTYYNPYGGNPYAFTNSATGTFRKTTPSDTLLGTGFYNYGTVDTRAGTFYVTGGGQSYDGSTFSASAGATNAFSAAYTLDGTLHFRGPGANQVSGGALSGTFTIDGQLNWVGGTLGTPGTTTILPGSLLVAAVSLDDIPNRTIELQGTFQHVSGDLRGGSSLGSIINNSGLFVESVPADNYLYNPYGGNPFVFNNYSTFLKTTGTTTTLQTMAFNNYGLVDVGAGSVTFSSSLYSPDGSTINAAGGTAVSYVSPDFEGTVNFTGSGRHQLTGGTLFGAASLQGDFHWVGGNLNTAATTTIPAGATFTAEVAGNDDLILHTINVSPGGTMVHLVGDLRGGSTGGSTINVAGNFRESVAGDDYFYNPFGGGPFTINNAGTFQKTTTGNTILQGMAFNNTGVLAVGAGTLTVNGTLFSQTAGSTTLSGGMITGNSILSYTGGTISGTGSVLAPLVASSLLLSPDLPAGYLAFNTLTATGVVRMPFRNPALAPPRLVIAQRLAFDGTGTFDLSDNDLILRGMTVDAVVTQMLAAQLISSYGVSVGAIGIIPNDDGRGGALYPTYDGQVSVSSDVLVKYTYLGDTNLDGHLDAGDLSNLLAGMNGGLPGWVNGDNNYDGTVDAADLNRLLNTMASQVGSFGNSTGGSAVPEPSGVAFISPAVALLRRRRR